MKKVFLALAVVGAFIIILANSSGNYNSAKQPFHTPVELDYYARNHRTPIGPGDWFLSSYSCRGCHGYDSLALANVDEDGNDVNLVNHWESSMMALSAKDPLWRAKVSQEILVNPAHEGELQDKCTSCHAPTGRYNHYYRGLGYYRLSDVVTDTLGFDGVNCTGCHTISPSTGQTFSGITPYDTTRQVYGPFTLPSVGPMQLYEGYTPTYSTHMDESILCSSCHTLQTRTADLAGNYTGGIFTEQATYHEYLNSSYPANNIKCQTCHMPRLTDPIVIANGFLALQPRFPFNQHVFAGANSFMLNLIKANKTALDVQVPDVHFDTTISATVQNLQQNSIGLTLLYDSTANDTAFFRVKLLNKAGHKFPSGYPSRRAVVQFIVTDQSGDTVFKSGTFDPNYRVVGETPAFEPHHSIITRSDVPQIYEMVMGDVNGNFTSVLERGSVELKDNRIPPSGFTSTHSAYDTVTISPDAFADDDFNKINGVEGSGTDYIHYHVPVNSVNGIINVKAAFYYQSVPPKWLDEMFTLSSPEINTFEAMFNGADKTPVLVGSDSLNLAVTSVISAKNDGISIFPTLTSGQIHITSGSLKIESIIIYTSDGEQILFLNSAILKNSIDIEGKPGIYFVRVLTDRGVFIRKIIKQ